MTEVEKAVIEAAIQFYQSTGGVPALTAAKKLEKAVEALLREKAKVA